MSMWVTIHHGPCLGQGDEAPPGYTMWSLFSVAQSCQCRGVCTSCERATTGLAAEQLQYSSYKS
eukprot:4544763-Amphidinium_carterae.1